MSLDKMPELLSGYAGEEGELIPLLQAVQREYGYISEEAVGSIAPFLKISENQIYGVASFYSQFRFSAPGRHAIKVCLGTACHVRSGQILAEAVSRELDVAPGEATKDGRFDLQRVACLGCCALAPVFTFDDRIYGQSSVLKIQETLDAHQKPRNP